MRQGKVWYKDQLAGLITETDEEELALTLAGKKKKFKKQHFDQLGQGMGMTAKQIEGAYRRMKKNRPKAMDWIQRSFLSEGLKHAYEGVLETRYRQLDLL